MSKFLVQVVSCFDLAVESVPSASLSLLPGFAKMPATPADPDSPVAHGTPTLQWAAAQTHMHSTHTRMCTHTCTLSPSACWETAGRGRWRLGLGVSVSKGPRLVQEPLLPAWAVAGGTSGPVSAPPPPTPGPRCAVSSLQAPGLGSLLPRARAPPPTPHHWAHPTHCMALRETGLALSCRQLSSEAFSAPTPPPPICPVREAVRREGGQVMATPLGP